MPNKSTNVLGAITYDGSLLLIPDCEAGYQPGPLSFCSPCLEGYAGVGCQVSFRELGGKEGERKRERKRENERVRVRERGGEKERERKRERKRERESESERKRKRHNHFRQASN
jgi:hypothetical protein